MSLTRALEITKEMVAKFFLVQAAESSGHGALEKVERSSQSRSM